MNRPPQPFRKKVSSEVLDYYAVPVPVGEANEERVIRAGLHQSPAELYLNPCYSRPGDSTHDTVLSYSYAF